MDYSAILSQFAQSLLMLALPVLAAYLARTVKAWLETAAAGMQARASAETRYLLSDAALIAVRAAEQLGGASDAKLSYAVKLAQGYLDKHGITVDLDLLRGLIESEVKAQFGKPPARPSDL